MIREGDKLIFESGDSTRAETSFSLAESTELKIVCPDEYYQKVTTQNKCRWRITFDPYNKQYADPNRWLLPVHAREAVTLFTNMAYLFSTDEFVKAHLRLQGRIYTDNGTEDWVDMKKLLDDIYAERHLSAYLTTYAQGAAMLGGGIFGLTECIWFSHYNDTADGDISWVAFHEFAHSLGFNHNSNMTEGAQGGAYWGEWPDKLCSVLYRQMCITRELPVWSSSFLKSKYCPEAYDYDTYVRP